MSGMRTYEGAINEMNYQNAKVI
jgi:hypothetical protein